VAAGTAARPLACLATAGLRYVERSAPVDPQSRCDGRAPQADNDHVGYRDWSFLIGECDCTPEDSLMAQGGTYVLHNHPRAEFVWQQLGYGLRVDGLLDTDKEIENGAVSLAVFDFDAAGAAVYLTYDVAKNRVHIFGTVVGGKLNGTIGQCNELKCVIQNPRTYELDYWLSVFRDVPTSQIAAFYRDTDGGWLRDTESQTAYAIKGTAMPGAVFLINIGQYRGELTAYTGYARRAVLPGLACSCSQRELGSAGCSCRSATARSSTRRSTATGAPACRPVCLCATARSRADRRAAPRRGFLIGDCVSGYVDFCLYDSTAPRDPDRYDDNGSDDDDEHEHDDDDEHGSGDIPSAMRGVVRAAAAGSPGCASGYQCRILRGDAVCVAAPHETVGSTEIRLVNLRFHEYPEGSLQRGKLQDDIEQDVIKALNLGEDRWRVYVSGLREGSVIATVSFRDSPVVQLPNEVTVGAGTPGVTVSDLVLKLASQAADRDSPLYGGKVTRYTDSNFRQPSCKQAPAACSQLG
jgi:hypothetical protein